MAGGLGMKWALLTAGILTVTFRFLPWSKPDEGVVGGLLIVAAALYEVAGEIHRLRR
jgi:hypothetical protein